MVHHYNHRQGHDPPSLFANLCRLREPADRGPGLCRGALHSGHPPHPQWVHMSVLVCAVILLTHIYGHRLRLWQWCLLCGALRSALQLQYQAEAQVHQCLSTTVKDFTLMFLTCDFNSVLSPQGPCRRGERRREHDCPHGWDPTLDIQPLFSLFLKFI